MLVRATVEAPVDTRADTVAIGIFDGKRVAHDVDGGVLQALLDAGEAKSAFKHLAHTHAAGKRWILVGLGDRDTFDAERARVAAATVLGRCGELGTKVLCWELPHRLDDDQAGGFVEGTVLSSYRFDWFKSAAKDEEDAPGVTELIVSDHESRVVTVDRAAVVARAQNATRELQDRPANDLTPTALGEFALTLADAHAHITASVEGRAEITARGMGAFASVAQGTDVEPALITVRYDPPEATGPVLGFVGKAVTHDTGGLSIKPAGGMHRMKYDMSGGGAVLGAMQAIAALALPIRIIAVVGATENTINGSATKPGDIVKAMTGLTIEVDNTDAEGRLVLADCLAHAVALGAERLVDLATLTGGVVTALGSTFAGLFANEEAWCAAVTAAGARSGERLWQLPLDPEYAERVKGRFADLTNSPEDRKAHPISGAEFLHRFVGDVPWAHLDIAGVGWDLGKPWAAKGGSGFGVRLLVALAQAQAGGA
ncbi:leucyl aminopeptidase [Paraconexibacter antarcticus]|uniref:Probable cytosol aminopeptidase n=1 Tax=Paraconexibacter antarcticus TaxID=2949664 RepID=A0ABY5E0W2_9ACTN|nr:leucyl aminopeptidase [Paraconexibacter antarcticus]UTI66492.1 leucyl aminopeptidase [Paraconexibacter antarcticus]